MSNDVLRSSNFLDRLYDTVSLGFDRYRAAVALKPTKHRRLLVVAVLSAFVLLATGFVIHPILTEIGDALAWREYNGKFSAANERATTPAEKSALLLLGSCMSRNQFASTRSTKILMLDRAEQFCLGQTVGQVMLSGGEDKARELVAIYARFDFKIDDRLSQALGL